MLEMGGCVERLRAVSEWGQVLGHTALFGAISYTGARLGRSEVSAWATHQWSVQCCDLLQMERTLIHGARLASAPQCIFVANHLSALDIILLGAFLRRDYRWLAKSSLFHTPIIGAHLRAAGHIPVHRAWSSERRAAFIARRVSEVVAEGADVLFFPEGTRSVDGALQPFRLGAFQSAVAEGLPIVPLVLTGTHEAMRKGDLRVRATRRRSSLTVLDPLYPPSEGDARRRASTLRDQTWAAMAAALAALPSLTEA
ncbi:1-acyl-sn-glycerol-3-phosphate acyltransferase [Myxococcota bacterium]|nr:1-acyl-sn-glycerol-3-phosphate acyltransferase [Myxococcota bacterium]